MHSPPGNNTHSHCTEDRSTFSISSYGTTADSPAYFRPSSHRPHSGLIKLRFIRDKQPANRQFASVASGAHRSRIFRSRGHSETQFSYSTLYSGSHRFALCNQNKADVIKPSSQVSSSTRRQLCSQYRANVIKPSSQASCSTRRRGYRGHSSVISQKEANTIFWRPS